MNICNFSLNSLQEHDKNLTVHPSNRVASHYEAILAIKWSISTAPTKAAQTIMTVWGVLHRTS
jgi:hypothetical protein